MKSLYYFFQVALFTLIAYSADGKSKALIPYHSGDKWGYANEKGKIIIQPQWSRADLFVNGKAIVTVKERWQDIPCLIDAKGNYIIPPSLHWDGSFNELFNISDSLGNYGRVDSNGRVVISVVYRSGGSHIYFDERTNGYKVIRKNGEAYMESVINADGRIIIPAEYDRIDYISKGPLYFFVYYPGQAGAAVLDSAAHTVLKFGPEGITCVPYFLENSHTLVFHIKDYFLLWKNFPNGTIDTLYAIDISPGSTGYIYRLQNKRGKYGAIDSMGKIVMDTVYTDIYFGKKKIITERPVADTGKYEYGFLDAYTLNPLEASRILTAPEIAKYLRDTKSEEKEENDIPVIPYIKCDEIVKQEDSVVYKKGAYSFVVSSLVTSNIDFIQLAFAYKTYIPVKVYRRTDNTFLGYSIADVNLDLKAPPQPYKIVDISAMNKSYLLQNGDMYAIADTNLRVVFPYQKARLDPLKYFIKNGKKYAAIGSRRRYKARSDNQCSYDYEASDLAIPYPLVGEGGDTLRQFSKYPKMQFLHSNWSVTDKRSENLMATDWTGKMGMIDIKAHVLFDEVSFKYKSLTQLGNNLFAVSDDGKIYTLVDKHNTPAHPLLSIRSVAKAHRRSLLPKGEDEEVAGLYMISVPDQKRSGKYYFYINSNGTLFTDMAEAKDGK